MNAIMAVSDMWWRHWRTLVLITIPLRIATHIHAPSNEIISQKKSIERDRTILVLIKIVRFRFVSLWKSSFSSSTFPSEAKFQSKFVHRILHHWCGKLTSSNGSALSTGKHFSGSYSELVLLTLLVRLAYGSTLAGSTLACPRQSFCFV